MTAETALTCPTWCAQCYDLGDGVTMHRGEPAVLDLTGGRGNRPGQFLDGTYDQTPIEVQWAQVDLPGGRRPVRADLYASDSSEHTALTEAQLRHLATWLLVQADALAMANGGTQ